FGSDVRSATFSSDGQRIVLASSNGMVRIWDVARQTQSWDNLAADACTRLLSDGSRRFMELEIETDQLLQTELPDPTRDVCAGVEGVPSFAELNRAAGIKPADSE
ncbi:MAG: hypothetical protein KJ961_01785, partial [Alphaproteobacteria bacterium]|nr:hypothetical protein [Alphaproteobacteria bacterium]